MSRRPASPDEIRRAWERATRDILVAIILAALCIAALDATLLWLAGVL